MSTKFFNNTEGTLFDKLKGIAQDMTSFKRFWAVAGYFRSSGYFKLRQELGDIEEIKILVGINIDNIFHQHNKALLMLGNETKAKEIYSENYQEDINTAKYDPEIEKGIKQMYQDLKDGRLRMRIHSTKNLHAKFYLCLPEKHTENSDGWVIMGSSNISESGLGLTPTPRYELNVAMKEYEDVKYCTDQFEQLWEESIKLTAADIDENNKKTYLGEQPTPYELYIKVLIDTFGDQVEDDFTIQLPDGVKDLKYQKDAVIQGYQMLMRHNGLFLADVVGLGKTMIATMITKRFIESNGSNTNVLVVFPPALRENWENTFKQFDIYKKAQFVTNGSLSKIIEGKDQYKDKEEFDLIIVDEAHGFRSDTSEKYDELQKICKASCPNRGHLNCTRKKVMLLSATPLNNKPEDLLKQLLLFQDSQSCTIDGIPNLDNFFDPLISEYKKLMKGRGYRDVTKEVDHIYEEIRNNVIDKVTVRRTRSNITNDADYRKDLEKQNIKFPNILPPQEMQYQMDADTSALFYETLRALSNTEDENSENCISYARYRAIEFLNPDLRKKYKNAENISQSLAGIFRVHMVKRLESSFNAFKISLHTLLQNTQNMLQMFKEDKVLIIPELNVKELQAKDIEIDEIIEMALNKGFEKEDFLYGAADFDTKFIEMLEKDIRILTNLSTKWEKENDDPKFDEFKKQLETVLLNPANNPTGKLVLFSESVDTLNYLKQRLTQELKFTDVLEITAKNRDQEGKKIKENFDANYDTQKNDYNLILTSDVLSEGVNLHRSNVIVNYDSPWNASRLMQRIGRVNRIGSVADNIYNYLFYPSQQGDNEIQLYKNALIKLQGFQSAFGEDAQIYSKEEVVKQFNLYDSNIKDSMDKRISLLREVRDLYQNDRKLYNKIKNLPLKSRVMRDTGKHSGESIIFVSSNVKTEFYLATNTEVKAIDFLEATQYLKAQQEEKAAAFTQDCQHYTHVAKALDKYQKEYVEAGDNTSINKEPDAGNKSKESKKFLRTLQQIFLDNNTLKKNCELLMGFIDEGVYAQLPKKLQALSREYKSDRQRIKSEEKNIQVEIQKLTEQYHTQNKKERRESIEINDPQIIVSESFI